MCAAGRHRLLPVPHQPFDSGGACGRILFKSLLPAVESGGVRPLPKRHVHLVGCDLYRLSKIEALA